MIDHKKLKLASVAALGAIAVGCSNVEETSVQTEGQPEPVVAANTAEPTGPAATKTVVPVSAQVVNLNVKGMT